MTKLEITKLITDALKAAFNGRMQAYVVLQHEPFLVIGIETAGEIKTFKIQVAEFKVGDLA